jgi:hypothetical protein
MIIDDFHFRNGPDQVQHMIQRLIQVGLIVADDRNGKDGPLPKIMMFDLGNGNIEPAPNAVLQTLQGLSFALQRPAIRNIKFDRTDADEHYERLQSCRYLFDSVSLDNIPNLDIVEVLDTEAALIS